MIKKILIAGISTFSLGLGIFSFSIITFSQSSDQDRGNACQAQYTQAMDAAKRDWQVNLESITNQEKPASEMVSEAYESMRTYNCWLEYICRGVEFSGHAPIQSTRGTGLTSQHIGQIPGCQKPEDITMNQEWADFTKEVSDIPLFGSAAVAIDGLSKNEIYYPDKFTFMPSCMTDPQKNNANPQLSIANDNYLTCKSRLEEQFGCLSEEGQDGSNTGSKECVQGARAFASMENVLKKTQGTQKASALENKLGGIVNKMHGLEAHASYVNEFLANLRSRMGCIASKCS